MLRSYQLATDAEYAATIARFCRANMAELTGNKARFPLGLFAVLRANGMLRPIVDGRPGNVFFLDLPMEHCGGDDLCCIIVDEGHTLLVAKVDLADYFHTILVRAGLRLFFGFRPVRSTVLKSLRNGGPARRHRRSLLDSSAAVHRPDGLDQRAGSGAGG